VKVAKKFRPTLSSFPEFSEINSGVPSTIRIRRRLLLRKLPKTVRPALSNFPDFVLIFRSFPELIQAGAVSGFYCRNHDFSSFETGAVSTISIPTRFQERDRIFRSFQKLIIGAASCVLKRLFGSRRRERAGFIFSVSFFFWVSKILTEWPKSTDTRAV
jgi:hypothetical protein